MIDEVDDWWSGSIKLTIEPCDISFIIGFIKVKRDVQVIGIPITKNLIMCEWVEMGINIFHF